MLIKMPRLTLLQWVYPSNYCDCGGVAGCRSDLIAPGPWSAVLPRVPSTKENMKLLSVNMYMDLERFPERLEALGKLVQSKRPEFVALQSVNSDAVKKIKASKWGFRYNVITPPTTFENRGKPMCAILSTYPSFKMNVYNYVDTTCPRHLLTGYYTLFDKQKNQFVVTVSTTNLEVGVEKEKSLMREKQLNQALSLLGEEQDCILLGDLGIIDPVDGDICYKGGWSDAWLSVAGKTDEEGHSFVPAENMHIKGKEIPSFRPDRVIFKTVRLKLESMEVVGKELVDGLHISSHFPVLGSYQILDNTSFASPMPPAAVPCVFQRPAQNGDEN